MAANQKGGKRFTPIKTNKGKGNVSGNTNKMGLGTKILIIVGGLFFFVIIWGSIVGEKETKPKKLIVNGISTDAEVTALICTKKDLKKHVNHPKTIDHSILHTKANLTESGIVRVSGRFSAKNGLGIELDYEYVALVKMVNNDECKEVTFISLDQR